MIVIPALGAMTHISCSSLAPDIRALRRGLPSLHTCYILGDFWFLKIILLNSRSDFVHKVSLVLLHM